MTWLNIAYNNFIGGEVSSDMYGRFDLDIYKKSSEALINFLVRAQGPIFFRPGFQYVASTRLNKPAVLKNFIFNASQSYILEFTDQRLRFFRNQTHVTEAEKKITNIAIGAQTTVTSNAHGYNNGDEVYIYDVVGPTRLNGKSYIVSDKSDNSFKLKNSDGEYIDSSGMPAYVSGGVAARIYEIATPYKESDNLGDIKLAQNADTVYIVHPKYQPRKLIRTNDTSWKLDTFSGTNFPFTSEGNFPRAVAFAQGRLWYGGTIKAPDKFWGSKGPKDDGTPQYDDFTTGTDEDSAVAYLLASSGGKVDDIRWISSNNKYLVIGTFGGVFKVTGSTDSEAISPTSINVRSLTSNGCSEAAPVLVGNSIYYVQRDNIIAREIYYDVYQDAYVAENRMLTASKIVGEGISQLVFMSGRLDILWARRKDGDLVGMSVNKSENVFGWHRHRLGGDPITETMAVIPQANWDDQLWVVNKRIINGKTRRYLEFITNEVLFPEKLDLFTGDKEGDEKRFDNVTFKTQQKYKHLDCHLSYDGGKVSETLLLEFNDSAGTVTIKTKSSESGSVDLFKESDEGREIWGAYDTKGVGGGRYRITKYVSPTQVECEVLSDPDIKDTELAPGEWQFTTDEVSGLEYLEGETVQVIVDGGVHPDVQVTNGVVKLESQHAVAHVGYSYLGVMKSLNLEGGGINGPAQSKHKRIVELGVRMLNTLGAEVGTDIYDMQQVLYANTNQYTSRPPRPFTGLKKIPVRDEWVGDNADDTLTQVVVVQKYPLPCEVQMIDAIMETVNE